MVSSSTTLQHKWKLLNMMHLWSPAVEADAVVVIDIPLYGCVFSPSLIPPIFMFKHFRLVQHENMDTHNFPSQMGGWRFRGCCLKLCVYIDYSASLIGSVFLHKCILVVHTLIFHLCLTWRCQLITP